MWISRKLGAGQRWSLKLGNLRDYGVNPSWAGRDTEAPRRTKPCLGAGRQIMGEAEHDPVPPQLPLPRAVFTGTKSHTSPAGHSGQALQAEFLASGAPGWLSG